MKGTLPGKPVIYTELSPTEIIGYQNYEAFVKHMKISCNRIDGGWPGVEIGRLDPGIRRMVSEVLVRLFDNGFVILGTERDGSIKFGCRMKSACDELFEGPELERLRRLPEKELQNMGRRGYLQTVENVRVPSVEKHETELQKTR